jgi:hypothetical protein
MAKQILGSTAPKLSSSLDASYYASMSDSQLKALSKANISVITAAQVAAMSSAQIGLFSSFDWFSPAAFAGLAAEDMPFVSTAGQKGYSWQYMSAQQVANLSPSAFAALSTSQLQTLSGNALKGVTAAQITALSKEQIGAFNSFDFVSPAAYAGLTAEDMPFVKTGGVKGGSWQYMSPQQVGNLSPSAFAALSKSQLQSLTYDAIKGITAAQISALSKEQIGWFNSFDWFSPAAFAGLAAEDMPYVATGGVMGGTWQYMSAEQVANLSPSAFAALSKSQLQSLTGDALKGVTAAQVVALTPSTFATLSRYQLYCLTHDAIKGITADKISPLSYIQICSFNSFDWFSPDAFAGLDAEDMPFVRTDGELGGSWEYMSAAQVQNLTASALGAMSVSQFKSLKPSVIGRLKPVQIDALRLEQIQALNSAQIDALTSVQIWGLTGAQIRSIDPAAVAGFSGDDLKTSDESGNKVLVDLAAPQIGKLTASQFKTLFAQDIQQISTTAISGLTPTQAAYTDASGKTVLSELTAAQLSAYQLAQSMAGGSKAAAITSSTANGSTSNQFQLTTPQ